MAIKKGGVSLFIYLVLRFGEYGSSQIDYESPLASNKKPNYHTQSHQKAGPQHLNGTMALPAIPFPEQVKGNRTWCIAKPSTSQEKLDDIIQYCCTQPKVDCKVIEARGMCYLPPNKISDSSVVMNIYYHISGKHPFNCYFKESSLIVTQDPCKS